MATMPGKSNIEWTDATWNPITGCDRISPGCDNCYALALAARLKAMGNARYQRDGGPRSGPGFGLTLHHNWHKAPNTWRKPRRIFVNSMSDLFHEDVPDEWRDAIFEHMESRHCSHHTFQILTKRHRLMQHYLTRRWADREPPPNIWLGVSVENQQWADTRIPWLVRTPAARRFLSCEPLIGLVDIRSVYRRVSTPRDVARHIPIGIHWVIVGAESGAGRRPFKLDWARSLQVQCETDTVPFFYKQGSAFKPGQNRELDGRTWDEMPDQPEGADDDG